MTVRLMSNHAVDAVVSRDEIEETTMPNDEPIEASLHVQKRVDRLQTALGDAKDKVVQDAKIPAAPQQPTDPGAELSRPAAGTQGTSVDEPNPRPAPVAEKITTLDRAEIDAKADGPVPSPTR
jgi:hypothetical protein